MLRAHTEQRKKKKPLSRLNENKPTTEDFPH